VATYLQTRRIHVRQIGPRTSKDELTNGGIDLVKSVKGNDTEVCHAMGQRSTNEEVDQMDEVHHRFQGRRKDQWPQFYQ
jgi:hypothetical protein